YDDKPADAVKPPVATKKTPEAITPTLPASPAAAAPISAGNPYPFLGVARVSVGARIRTDLAAALKRASLNRQLNGIEPHSLQDIFEEAIELWLHRNGLL